MAVTTELFADQLPLVGAKARTGFPASSLRFDWLMAFFTVLLVGGLYLDGWAHGHGKVDNTFFTPWHAVLYGAFGLSALTLVIRAGRNRGAGYAWQRSVPRGYALSLLGVLIFAVAGVADLVWHSVFGFEVNLETLLSPSHLALACGGLLIMSGPIRSIWYRYPESQLAETSLRTRWITLGPALFAAMSILAVMTFFTSFAHPLDSDFAAKSSQIKASNADEVYSMNIDGSGQTRLTNKTGYFGWFGAASPDSTKIAYSAGLRRSDPAQQTSDVFIMNSDGSRPVQLTHLPNGSYYPSWSPDGNKIAFLNVIDENTTDVYVANANGGEAKQITHSANQKWGTTWTADGKQIAFLMNGDGIYLVNADGSGEITRASWTQAGDSAPAWSPDGRRIAFARAVDGNSHVFTVNADGNGLKQIGDMPGWNPSWSADGSKIVFAGWADGDNGSSIFSMNADGTNPVNLTNNQALNSYLPLTTQRGKVLYTASGFDALPAWLTERNLAGGILLQTILLMGMALPLIRRWRLPFGTFTLLIAFPSLLMVTNSDFYSYLLGAIVTGVLGDVLYLVLKPSASEPMRFYGFAFAVPAIFYSLYFVTVQLTHGISWTIHLWLGAIVLAGALGVFVGFLVLSPFKERDTLGQAST